MQHVSLHLLKGTLKVPLIPCLLQLCVLGNLCPETVEEAIAMVPSIKVPVWFTNRVKCSFIFMENTTNKCV